MTAEEIALEFDVSARGRKVVDVIEELLKEDEETKRRCRKSACCLRYGSR